MLTRESYINSPVEIETELLHFFGRNDKLSIFDIGACEAEDSIRYSALFPNAEVYAFEPRIDNYLKGKELIEQYGGKNIVFENLALSEEDGTAIFYLSDGEPEGLKNDENWDYGNKSSSLLPPSEEMKKHIKWLSFEKKTSVKTMRLEDYSSEKNISVIDFVHLDVQGAELMVLKGAGKVLERIKLIWMEVESITLYENQPLKREVESYMKQRGFVNIFDTVGKVSGDQLYVNKQFFTVAQIKSAAAKRKRIKKLAWLKSLFHISK